MDFAFSDEKVKEVYDEVDERTFYNHEKSQKIYPFKKRKFFCNDRLSTSNRGLNREGAFISPDKRIDGKSYTSGATTHVPVPIFFNFLI